MSSPLLMNFSLFLSHLSPVFHSFVAFCHLALVTVSFILCIMLCCDDDDDDDDDDDFINTCKKNDSEQKRTRGDKIT